jgi:hypothetical protein
MGLVGDNLRKTHCPKGHPYSGDNLRLVANGTSRQCRACGLARDKGRWRKGPKHLRPLDV